MKKIVLPLVTLLGFGAALSAEIQTTFEDVNNFRDFTLSSNSPEKTQKVFEREIQRSRLQRYVGDDRVLELHFKDIDMAGDVQPWRNRDWHEIRYVESIYPPFASFDWVLRDASGQEVASGSENLRDLGFDLRLRPTELSLPFRYEFEMLEDWARKTLPRVEG